MALTTFALGVHSAGVAVAVFASNCKKAGASDRSKYLEELMKYIPVRTVCAVRTVCPAYSYFEVRCMRCRAERSLYR
jgi:hypothetical protein